MRQLIEDIERPLALFLMAVVLVPLIFFGVRYEMKVRAESRAQAKQEATYQATLRFYNQILKPGMKRKEVEGYLRGNKIEFKQQSLDDIAQIGQDESTSWFCGKSDVFVKFQFTAFAPRVGQPDNANERDTLDEIKIFRMQECL